MDKSKPTLAVYGIQDRENYPHPYYVHDHNLAIMQDGRVKSFLQQERVSRIKRDNTLHIYLKTLLKSKKLLGKEYDLVFVDNVVGRTFLTAAGDVRFEAPLRKSLASRAELGQCWWFGNERQAYALNHEIAHIFSCLPFFENFRDNSLLVHFDGGASKSNFSAATFRNGKLDWVEYHWTLKPFSSIYNANALVFALIGSGLAEQNSVPGKFMGLAGWGNYRPEIEKWLEDNHFFENIWGKTSLFFKKAQHDFQTYIASFDTHNRFLQDVAATLQHIFIKAVLKKLEELAEKTGTENLYYTGGSALNIVANNAIIESGIFKQIFIPPCTEDSGLALGAAAYLEWQKHGTVEHHSAYLNNWGIEDYKVAYSDATVKKVAEKIINKKVIGICNGFGEAGPRALGNRSILALANSKKLAKEISINKKGREWYRPLAPVALEKNTKYFTGQDKIHHLSKYMLTDLKVLPQHFKELAGAVHADGTARFQTIFSREENPFLFDLLQHLDLKYNVRTLLNTSFNTKGKPIVHTKTDALEEARNLKLNGLVVNGKFLDLD